ncbi:MAG: hypothetical protein ACPGVU_17855 [Limisphaerales bacterium]
MKHLLALLLFALPVFAGPSVTIVVGPKPKPLEELAAKEVATTLKQLFEADVTITKDGDAEGPSVLIGNPDTNPAIGRLMEWPDLSEQGHLLRKVRSGRGYKLIVGGGSPVATYWAACELGHYFGIRRLLHADFPPLNTPAFRLDEVDTTLEPQFQARAWRTMGTSPASQVSWSLEEHKLRLRQLTKLKFNHLIIPLQTWQPFVASGSTSGKQRTGRLWKGPELRVDGETAGRAAFGRERVFNNPELRDAKDHGQRTEAGIKLVRGIIAEAKRLGMRTTIEVEAPEAMLTRYRKTYPKADAVIPFSELETLPIGNLDGGLLPQFDLKQPHAAISDLRQAKASGFAVSCQLVDDLNTSVFYLSRASFDPGMTPKRAVDELVTPISGEVSVRIGIGFDHLAKAFALINENNPTIATPRKNVIMRHYDSTEAAPAWWGEAKGEFAMAMNEMYRANTRARGGARAYSLYLAKKFEFALHYFTCIESLRAAGIARSKKDKDGQLEGLDQAVEAMHNAMSAIADVDRNNADRGIIALFNEYGFRPLIKELEKADN